MFLTSSLLTSAPLSTDIEVRFVDTNWFTRLFVLICTSASNGIPAALPIQAVQLFFFPPAFSPSSCSTQSNTVSRMCKLSPSSQLDPPHRMRSISVGVLQVVLLCMVALSTLPGATARIGTATQAWNFTAPDVDSSVRFGDSVDLSADANYAIVAGIVHLRRYIYIFVRSGSSWREQQMLNVSQRARDRIDSHNTVALSAEGQYAIVGSLENRQFKYGFAAIFVRSGSTWSEQQLLNDTISTSDSCGYSVSISGDGTYALLGCPHGGSGGTALMFSRSGSTWQLQQKLSPSVGSNFGYSVALSTDGQYAMIRTLVKNTASGTGMAYIFVRSGSSWSEQQLLIGSCRSEYSRCGTSIAISSDGSYALIGASDDDHDDDQRFFGKGSAFVFKRSGSSWSEQQKLTASDGGFLQRFGKSVSLSADGDRALIGATGSEGLVERSGSAYVFVRSGESWSEEQELVGSDSLSSDFFGESASLSGDGTYSIVGAHQLNNPHKNGTAYIFFRCPSGMFCLNNTVSEPCSVGSFCPEWRMEELDCAAGTFCPTPTQSFPCSNGSFCLPRSVQGVDCPAGFQCPSPMNMTACSLGEYCPRRTMVAKPCPGGRFCASPSEIRKCSEGNFCPEGSTSETKCPVGTFSNNGASSCSSECPDADYMKMKEDGTGCVELYCFCFDMSSTVLSVSIVFALAVLSLLIGRVSVMNTIIIILSLGNFFSDILYVSTESFWSSELQWLCLSFLIASSAMFVVMIPPSSEFLSCWWVQPLRTTDMSSNGLKWIWFTVSWLFYIIFRLVIWPSCILVIGLFGMLLFSTKLLCISAVASFFIDKIWRSGKTETGDSSDGVLLLGAFNRMLVSEIVVEAIPQIAIQAINNRVRYGWVAAASLSLSLLVLLVHAWKFVSYTSQGVSWLEVPTLYGVANSSWKSFVSNRNSNVQL